MLLSFKHVIIQACHQNPFYTSSLLCKFFIINWPVTVGPRLGQLFEYCLLDKFGLYLKSDDLQFGFKRAHCTSHAIFAVKSCVNYYISHGSGVFVTFLDCAKAFDRVAYYGIFMKLIDRNVPLCFLNLIIYWYLNMSSCCQWNGEKSDYFRLITGTKQGGVLIPRIFAIYMDDKSFQDC